MQEIGLEKLIDVELISDKYIYDIANLASSQRTLNYNEYNKKVQSVVNKYNLSTTIINRDVQEIKPFYEDFLKWQQR